MSILMDVEIRELCTNGHEMISPYVDKPVRVVDDKKIISYGQSSAGYDVRITNEFEIFTNLNNTVVDPLDFDNNSLITMKKDVCIIPPHSYALARTVEYFKIPRDVMVICLGKSTYARCFTGDTKVALADGTNPTFLELIERSNNGERFWGYSVDNNLNIVMSELVAPRKIGHEKVIEVVLDNGESIRCTPDHKFITREGLEVQAKDLSEGDSLFPFYKVATPKGYQVIAQPNTWEYDFTHKLADDWNLRYGIYTYNAEEQARHHLDHNKLNNNPTNVVRMTPSDHSKYHNAINRDSAEIRDKISKTNKAYWDKMSQDEEWLEKQLDHLQYMASLWKNADNETKEKHVNKLKEYWKSEEGLSRKEVTRQRMRVVSSTEESKRRSSEMLKKLWQDPEFKEMMLNVAGKYQLRDDVTEEELRSALESEGSIRGAARKLNCDRSVFKRFSLIISEYKQKWDEAKITIQQFYEAMVEHGSASKAAKALNICKSRIHRHYKEALQMYYNAPVEENHKVLCIKELDVTEDVYCLTAPEFGNFALTNGVFVNNCGIIINVTPIEPEFEGHVVIEIANTTPLPAKIYAWQGIAQFLFFQGEVPCELSYKDKGGKYQGQTGITYAKG